MKRTFRTIAYGFTIATLIAGGALAQRVHARRTTTAPAASRIIAIPCVEACNMLQQMRVWIFTPPAGATQYGIASLGDGHRVWALLPTCGEANPDDPRDPCAVDHFAIELINGTGEVRSTEPQTISNTSTRRVQSFVVPNTAEQVRLKLLRHDNTVRWEAAIDSAQLHQLPPPEGSASGNQFAFDLTHYPSR